MIQRIQTVLFTYRRHSYGGNDVFPCRLFLYRD